MEKESNVSESIIDSISAENIKEVLLDLADAEVHTLLDNEALKDIPYVGILAKLASTGKRISDAIFTRKVLEFLRSANGASEEKKRAFKEKMDGSPKTKKRVGESLILLLDRMDDISKCELLGNLFRAYIDGKIDYSLFLRLSSMIDKVFLEDLIQLKRGRLGDVETSVKDLLALGGVVKSTLQDQRKFEEYIRQQTGAPGFTADVRYEYSMTAFGDYLLKFAFYKPA